MIKLLTVLLLLSGSAQALEIDYTAGVAAGPTASSHDDISVRLSYEVHGGIFLEKNWGLGITHFMSNAEEDDGAFNIAFFAADLNYRFTDWVKDLQIGLRFGLADVTTSTLHDEEITFVPPAYGIYVARIWFFGSKFSLGVIGHYLSVSGDDDVIDGDEVELEPFGLFSVLGTARLWF